MDAADVVRFLRFVLLFVVSITIHEFAHAVTADKLGDRTPRSQGRVSLNPVDHIDPIGLLAMAVSQLVGTGLGWGRPVFTDPRNFKKPRRDTMLVALAGPFSNFLQCVVVSIPLRMGIAGSGTNAERWLLDALWLNAMLCIFNLIPIGPLDGAKVLAGILHERDAAAFDLFTQRFGLIMFILLVTTHATRYIVLPPAAALMSALVPGTYLEQR